MSRGLYIFPWLVAATATGQDILTYDTRPLVIAGSTPATFEALGFVRYIVDYPAYQFANCPGAPYGLPSLPAWPASVVAGTTGCICTGSTACALCTTGACAGASTRDCFLSADAENLNGWLGSWLLTGSGQHEWSEERGTLSLYSNCVTLDYYNTNLIQTSQYESSPYNFGEWARYVYLDTGSNSPCADCEWWGCTDNGDDFSGIDCADPAINYSACAKSGCGGATSDLISESELRCGTQFIAFNPGQWTGIYCPGDATSLTIDGGPSVAGGRSEWCWTETEYNGDITYLVVIARTSSGVLHVFTAAEPGTLCTEGTWTGTAYDPAESWEDATTRFEGGSPGVLVRHTINSTATEAQTSAEAIITRLDELLALHAPTNEPLEIEWPGEDSGFAWPNDNTPGDDIANHRINAGNNAEINNRLWTPGNENPAAPPSIPLGDGQEMFNPATEGLAIITEADAATDFTFAVPFGPETLTIATATMIQDATAAWEPWYTTARALMTMVALGLIAWRAFHWITWGFAFTTTLPKDEI